MSTWMYHRTDLIATTIRLQYIIYMFFYEKPFSFWLYHSRRDVIYNGIFRSDEVNESIRKKIEFVEKDNAF